MVDERDEYFNAASSKFPMPNIMTLRSLLEWQLEVGIDILGEGRWVISRTDGEDGEV